MRGSSPRMTLFLDLLLCGFPSYATYRLYKLEPVFVRVAVVDEDRVEAGDAGPAFDAGDDRRVVADLRFGLDAAVEQAADDALMHEIVADAELASGGELGHPRRGRSEERRVGKACVRTSRSRCSRYN